MLSITQRYKMKAIHNDIPIAIASLVMLSITQRYKMKAIHNKHSIIHHRSYNVVNNAKIQNESNSQLLR